MKSALYLLSISIFASSLQAGEVSAPEDNIVVCIHGFLGTPFSMNYLETKLADQGFTVINWGYDSKKAFIADHGTALAFGLKGVLKKYPNKKITFVTHSMGGLVLLAALNHAKCPDIARYGKAALIAPPMKGAWIARFLGRSSFARWIAHRFAGVELMTEKDFAHLGSYPSTLENICVIAGSWSMNPLFRVPNDGAVTVEETVLDVAHEHVTVNAGHHDIVFNEEVSDVVFRFITRGTSKPDVEFEL